MPAVYGGDSASVRMAQLTWPLPRSPQRARRCSGLRETRKPERFTHTPQARPASSPRPISHGRRWRLLKQLRDELVKVVTPVDPRVAAGRFLIHRREAVLLEQLDSPDRRLEQEIIFAGGEPEQLQSLFQPRIVQSGPMLLFPICGSLRGRRRSGWRRRRCATASTGAWKCAKQAGAVHADVSVVVQISDGDLQGVTAAH